MRLALPGVDERHHLPSARVQLEQFGAAIYVERVPKLFEFPPDPDDAPYIDLAIQAGAFALVTRDREVLRLGEADYELARRLRERHPCLHLAIPERFLELVDAKPSMSEMLKRRSVRRE